MKVTIKPVKGDNFDVECDAEATVEALKKIIGEAKPEFPADLQKLIYTGKILKDEDKVGELGLKEGTFIVVMVAKAKPPAASAAPAATPAAAPAAPAGEAPAAGGDAADPAAAAAANLVSGSGMEATVTQLCDMGFPRAEVERCLAAAFNNPDRAVEYLMNGIPDGILAAGGEEGGDAPAEGGGGGGGGGGGAAPGAGGNAFPAMAGAGGGGEAIDIPPALQALRSNPQFTQLAGMIAQNPQMLAQMLPALQQSHPDLVQVIQQHPQAFMQVIAETAAGGAGGEDPVAAMMAAAGGGGGGGGGGAPGQTVIRLSEEEREAVERLAALGFDRNMAVQAYLACDKNEELAANFLFDSGNDMTD